jgi:hypothetical protein
MKNTPTLTPEQARHIREHWHEMWPGKSRRHIAAALGMGVAPLGRLLRGETYKSAGGPIVVEGRITRELFGADAGGASLREIARELGVSQPEAERIMDSAVAKFRAGLLACGVGPADLDWQEMEEVEGLPWVEDDQEARA